MATTKKTRRTVSPAPKQAAARRASNGHSPSEGDIAMRAYELFIQRGGEHGRDLEDWLLAQRELSADR